MTKIEARHAKPRAERVASKKTYGAPCTTSKGKIGKYAYGMFGILVCYED